MSKNSSYTWTLDRKLTVAAAGFSLLFASNLLVYSALLKNVQRMAPAVDTAGRQRMLSQKIAFKTMALAAGREAAGTELSLAVAAFDEAARALARGGPARGLLLPPPPRGLEAELGRAAAEWEPYKTAALTAAGAGPGSPAFKAALAEVESRSGELLAACDALTAAYRGKVLGITELLTLYMAALLAASLLLGTAMVMYTRRRVVRPLEELERAALRISAGDHSGPPPPAAGGEIGTLSDAFGRMSSAVKRDSETRAALYNLLEVSLQQEPLPEIFNRMLERLFKLPWLGIESRGAVFLSGEDGTLRMAAERGMSTEIKEACAAVRPGHCLCGRAAESGETVFARHLDERHEVAHEGMRPHGHYCLPIKLRTRVLGVLTIYLPAGHEYNPEERDFLESVCAVLAKVIEYKELQAVSSRSQHLEALGHMAGSVAHDFNNVITAARGLTELAAEGLPPGSPEADYLAHAAASLNTGKELAAQILQFSRHRTPDMARLDLCALVRGLERMLKTALQNNITLRFSLPAAPLWLKANRTQLEQVILNLALNARDAMPGGGTLQIEAAAGAAEDRRRIRLTVSDTGQGIPEQLQARVFESFFTTKPEDKGTGLGLPTVRNIVIQHGGTVRLRSRAGEGAAFDIFLPEAEEPGPGRQDIA